MQWTDTSVNTMNYIYGSHHQNTKNTRENSQKPSKMTKNGLKWTLKTPWDDDEPLRTP